MNLLRLWLAVLALVTFPATAFGRYVFVVPSAGSANQLLGYTETGQSMGPAVTTPAAPVEAFSNYGGTAAFVVTTSTNFQMGIVQIVNNQFSGPMVGLSLGSEGFRAKTWRLSPTGGRIAVLAVDPFNPNTRGAAYVLDANTGALISWRSVQLFQQGVPQDVAFSNDGETLAVLTHTQLQFVRVEDGSVLSTYTFSPINLSSDGAYLSVGPNGSFYVSSVFRLFEFAGRAPFNLFGISEISAWPGRLTFSPDGRYGLMIDKRGQPATFSAVGVDLNTRNPAIGNGAGTPLAGVAIPQTGSTTPVLLDSVQIINELQAIGFSSVTGRMYLISYPTMTVTDYTPGGTAVVSNVTSVAISNEIPGARTLWYNQMGGLYRVDLTTNTVSPGIPSIAGPTTTATLPNTDTTSLTTLRGYNGGQTVNPGEPLPRPYYVRAFDSFGRPVFNAPVTITTTPSGIALSGQSTATNALGYAYVNAIAPPTAGLFTVTFNIMGQTISLTSGSGSGGGGGGGGGTEPPPTGAGLRKTQGDGAIRQILDATVPLVLKVRAVGADGKPIAGKVITWASPSELQFIYSGAFGSSVTDADGYAEVGVLLTGVVDIFSPVRNYVATATSDLGTATFNIIGYPFSIGSSSASPLAFITKPDGDQRNFTLRLGEKLPDAIRVAVASSGGTTGFIGAPIPGAAVRLLSNNTDPNLGPVISCEGDYVSTAADGVASCNLVATGKTGATYFNIDVGWGHQVFSTFFVNVQPGAPVAPVISSGNNQQVRPGEDAPQSLVAIIQDAGGNLLSGQQVTWEVVTPNSLTLFNTISTSDLNGRVSTRVRGGNTAGSYQVKVTIAGTTLSATFNVSVVNVVTGFSKVSGDNQPTVVINTAFPNPLVVFVYDQANRGVPNVQVNFAVASGSATVSPAVATTNAQGQASVTVTAGPQAGPITVQATLQNFTPITWSLNSRLPGPVLTAQSFTNFATGEVGVVPGSLVLITGPGIAPNVKGERNANLLTAQLPYEIEGVTVEFRWAGRSAFAPIMTVSNINGVETALIQAPYELAGASTTDVRVVSGGDVLVTGVQVRPVGPGILEDTLGGTRAAIAIRSDGLRVTPSTPARRGEIIRLYVIGLGQTTPTAETNRVGMIDQKVIAAVSVGLDDRGITPISAHMAENLFAVYEVVFRVPADATVGNNRPLGLVMEPAPGQQFYANSSTLHISAQ